MENGALKKENTKGKCRKFEASEEKRREEEMKKEDRKYRKKES